MLRLSTTVTSPHFFVSAWVLTNT
ncbi:hypothetical protein E2C01_058560 [Portunus trituberculatus]|uniref:Uncharacterized protein n=1 Tax=Portunus trituberculatus TaxID=210409 RepID=A0A5B7H6G7_PORTR|nr:hypothetical protein [Portunus trituberculatus]